MINDYVKHERINRNPVFFPQAQGFQQSVLTMFVHVHDYYQSMPGGYWYGSVHDYYQSMPEWYWHGSVHDCYQSIIVDDTGMDLSGYVRGTGMDLYTTTIRVCGWYWYGSVHQPHRILGWLFSIGPRTEWLHITECKHLSVSDQTLRL